MCFRVSVNKVFTLLLYNSNSTYPVSYIALLKLIFPQRFILFEVFLQFRKSQTLCTYFLKFLIKPFTYNLQKRSLT